MSVETEEELLKVLRKRKEGEVIRHEDSPQLKAGLKDEPSVVSDGRTLIGREWITRGMSEDWSCVQ